MKFVCKKCNHEEEVLNYIIAIRGDNVVYINKIGKKLICCNSCEEHPNLEPVKEDKDLSAAKIGKFASMSLSEKQKLLQQRSSNHFQREIKEKKHEMGKETIKKLLNK